MSNDHIKADIALYLSGGLAESRNRQIEAHAAACDKCRVALAKARAKQARVKREALKKADSLPNLFLARQGKEAGVDHSSSKGPWVGGLVILVAGVGFWAMKQSSFSFHPSVLPTSDPTLAIVETSTAPVPSPKSTPAPAPVPKVPAPEVKAEPPKPPVAVQILQEWKGAESAVKEPRVVVVRKKELWDKLWVDSQIPGPIPEVDFSKHLVMGVFAGERAAGSSIGMGKVTETDDGMYAPYYFLLPAVQVSSAPAQVPSHPYLFSLVSRVDKKVRLSQEEAPR